MRRIRKIVTIFEKEYFIEFNVWNDKVTGKHCFFINLRNNITNPIKLNIRYDCYINTGKRIQNYRHYNLDSIEAKRLVLQYLTFESINSFDKWYVTNYF